MSTRRTDTGCFADKDHNYCEDGTTYIPETFFQRLQDPTDHRRYFLRSANEDYGYAMSLCVHSGGFVAGFESLEHKLATREIIVEYGTSLFES